MRGVIGPAGHTLLDEAIEYLRVHPFEAPEIVRSKPCRDCPDVHPFAFFWRGSLRRWHEIDPRSDAWHARQERK